ncbi:hypothetical protein FRACYDRAFT_233860 [Fragilariopsis cylindrus CCMP1102]|uniref:Uncharacterized protein n=1 Tax=Fragilariopsis cylindrus CCMP1102 TaxID=635003 RepID=A0A1E7FZW0_9STRA|nr:hypothetical protein FRACYDRAFT_233860 [Fragilariopsis cylindrus CCMP1102]|eukprot:OEU23687.1 hypothetical protein FRACYDRAFT_233860 [Fragilariopsis cylindrus CCMP1102]
MSGSDLAPFVAAVLRDSTVDKLKNENDGLRELLEERLLLQITGQDGAPIHYEISMKNGTSKQGDNERDLWVVNMMIGSNNKEENTTFDDNNDVIPLDSIIIGKFLEIWVGGQFLQRFDFYTCRVRRMCFNMIGTNDGFDRNMKDVPQMGLIAILPTLDASISSSVPIIYAKFGPILFDEYHNLPQQLSMGDLYSLIRASNNGTPKFLMVQKLLFRKTLRALVTVATTVIAANGIEDEEDDDDDNDNGDAEL